MLVVRRLRRGMGLDRVRREIVIPAGRRWLQLSEATRRRDGHAPGIGLVAPARLTRAGSGRSYPVNTGVLADVFGVTRSPLLPAVLLQANRSNGIPRGAC